MAPSRCVGLSRTTKRKRPLRVTPRAPEQRRSPTNSKSRNPKPRTTNTMSKSIVGIATSTSQVENTLRDLQNDGLVSASDISVLMPESAGTPELGAVKETKAPEGATAGAATGGVIGGTVGLLAGIGALAIPGLGPFIAAGPIMAALGGAAAGAHRG